MMVNYEEYIRIYKDYKKFKKDKKIVWSRYYFDDYLFDRRVNFVLTLIKNYVMKKFVMEIKFWEENQKIIDFFEQTKNSYTVFKRYEGGQKPGIIVVDDTCLDVNFFEQLLQNHYNYELAYKPALSVKILLFVKQDENLTVFDFYDDRGFIINHYYLQ